MITGVTGSGTPNPGDQGPQNQNPVYEQPPAYQAPYPQAAPPPQVRYVEVTPGSPSGGGSKNAIVLGAIVALVGASIYNMYEINQLKTQLTSTREVLTDEVGRIGESASQTTRASTEALKKELAEARRQAAQLVGQAKIDAARNVDELEGKVAQAQAQQAAQTAKVAESVTAVTQQVSAVKEDTKAGFSAVNTEVAAVRSQADSTKAELQKTIADLTSTQGDLGVQSGLIATNAKELRALRELGERNYTEFRLAKAKTTQKVGDLQIRLTKTDEKKNKYTVLVSVDDKLVEKKDKTVNEPVQFLVPRYSQPFELVVNEVRKDMIIGYVSAPKVQAARN